MITSTSGHNRPTHYEMFVRRTAQGAWTLEMASEHREQIVEAAEELYQSRKGLSVKVSKEVLDPETGEYSSATILSKGVEEAQARARVAVDAAPPCQTPHDLYSPVAREKISRLLEDWLRREKVTAFELLHRPDLAQKLDASVHEIQHVVQKLAIAESHDTGHDLHERARPRAQGVVVDLVDPDVVRAEPAAPLDE